MSCCYYSTEWQRGEYGYSWDSLTTSVSFLKKSQQQQQQQIQFLITGLDTVKYPVFLFLFEHFLLVVGGDQLLHDRKTS